MLLAARDLAPRIGGRTLIGGVTLTLAAGEVVALVGPNGVGKTSLLRALLGLLPHEGEVLWDDKLVGVRSRRGLARRVAYLPQQPPGDAGHTVGELLALGRVPHLGPLGGESAADRRAVTEVAHRLGLTDLLARPVASLSGGQRQRVRLGRALAQQPAALLLDEPDTYLDLARQAELAGLLADLAGEGLGIVLASHDLNFAAAVAGRVALLGPASRVGPPREVLTAANLHAAFGPGVRVREHPWAVAADFTGRARAGTGPT